MDERMKIDRGFTLIELMVVIAVVSILAVIALPMYLDYTIKAKVSEALAFADEAKTAVTETYSGTGQLPLDNEAAGLPPSLSYAHHTYMDKLVVGKGLGDVEVPTAIPGTITLFIGISALGMDNQLQLVPSTAGAGNYLTWSCKPALTNGIETRKIPPNCRG